MSHTFVTAGPFTGRSKVAFMCYAAGLWTSIIGVAISLFTLGYLWQSGATNVVFTHVATVVSAQPSGAPGIESGSWWQQDVLVVFLALGLSVITVGLLLLLTGHMVRSRQTELHAIQSHQEEL